MDTQTDTDGWTHRRMDTQIDEHTDRRADGRQTVSKAVTSLTASSCRSSSSFICCLIGLSFFCSSGVQYSNRSSVSVNFISYTDDNTAATINTTAITTGTVSDNNTAATINSALLRRNHSKTECLHQRAKIKQT